MFLWLTTCVKPVFLNIKINSLIYQTSTSKCYFTSFLVFYYTRPMKTKNPVTLSLNHCDFSIIRLHFTFKITYKTRLLEKKKLKSIHWSSIILSTFHTENHNILLISFYHFILGCNILHIKHINKLNLSNA